ncbi:MAG: hypothetical protein ACAI35_18730 [Candidatus Methylacidiphilales bacterium]|nr:hypothetical protein [Candidatus Methylacidiphilales bacterium]
MAVAHLNVKLLIAYGADRTARTGSGCTASDLTRKIGWAELADSILQ